MNQVVLSLGSNVGDRKHFLTQATIKLSEFISDLTISKMYVTKAIGMEKGHDFEFMNMACYGSTCLVPHEVLKRTLHIEKLLGRERGTSENYLSRTIDIDILFYNSAIIESKELVIPHPRLIDRKFVLQPLSEILPNYKIPGVEITVLEALSKLKEDE